MSATASRPGRPLVLVVDDDADILDAICDILAGEGFRVARARNGLEALERVEQECPSMILLDLMMPVMDGLAFARALRARRCSAGIPIVVISADGSAQKAASAGAHAFLAKPFEIHALLAQVEAFTRHPGRTRPPEGWTRQNPP